MLCARPYRFVALNNIVYWYRLNPDGISATSPNYKKSVDSYWITELCLKEFQKFGLNYNQNAYEYLLCQTIKNWGRTKKRPIGVRKAIFILTAQLIEYYFPNYCTGQLELLQIESAIKNKHFMQYELLMRGK